MVVRGGCGGAVVFCERGFLSQVSMDQRSGVFGGGVEKEERVFSCVNSAVLRRTAI